MEPARLLPRSVLADQVKERLLDGILTGRFAPDSRIVETQVARELGTSQAPVREALRGLEALGVVEITPFRGARVRRPTRRELLEAYAIRTALESLGARLAVPRLSDDDLDELSACVDEMQAAARDDDGAGVAEADARFHGRILELADNATLVRVWRSLEPFSRTYITLVVPGADPQWSADLHVPILAALRRRDVDAVVAALERHFEEVSANMADRLPDDDDGANPMTTDDFVLSEEMVAGPARLRIDVLGGEPREHVLDDMNFMNYRLADVRIAPEVIAAASRTSSGSRDGEKAIAYDGRRMTFTGDWPAGPIQKVIVAMLALRMEAVGLHPFHASAVRYRDKTVLFLGGESNHGKSMGQIEACRRGARLVSTETTVIDEDGRAVMGSKDVFLKKRDRGHRAGRQGRRRTPASQKFFGEMPSGSLYDGADASSTS